MEQFLMLVTTALISGLLATIVTIIWQRKNAKNNRKFDVFNTLMSHRYMIGSEANVNALNTIDVIFSKDIEVREAYKSFLTETAKIPVSVEQIDEKFLKLLDVMANTLKYKNIHWDEIKHYYYPVGLSERITEEATLRKLQIQSASSSINNAKQGQNTSKNDQLMEKAFLTILPELIEDPSKIEQLAKISEKLKRHS